MEKQTLSQSPLWREFQAEARKRRRNPMRLLTEYMRECLGICEGQKLDATIRRDVQGSGYTEEEAVDIVRRHRLEKGRRASP
jgi:hypothetical protein